MKLTRGQRDRTALLLRCTAWVAITGDHVLGPGFHTAGYLGLTQRDCDRAMRAAQRVARDTGRDPDQASTLDEYIEIVLEAARRIEEGSWPV
jgi:hypothetical protein